MDNIGFDWHQVNQGCTSSPKPLEMCTFSLWACKHRSCQCPSTFCGWLIHKPHKAFICFECWLQDRIRGKSRVKTLDFNFCLMANSCPAFTPEVKKKKRKEKGKYKNSKTVLLDFWRDRGIIIDHSPVTSCLYSISDCLQCKPWVLSNVFRPFSTKNRWLPAVFVLSNLLNDVSSMRHVVVNLRLKTVCRAVMLL